jgi:hypothetical protein
MIGCHTTSASPLAPRPSRLVRRLEAVAMDEATLPVFVSHGTSNAYTNYGCRCEVCREAHSLYRSERRARDPGKYTAYMREYMRKYRARKRGDQAR